jgi:hypothetical protein
LIKAEKMGAMLDQGRTRPRRPRWGWLALIVTLIGFPLMLATIAIGVGDTSVGNSSSPWILGDIIVLGVPVTIGALVYVARRQSGRSRLVALASAVLIPVAALISLGLIVWLIVAVSS